MKIKKQSTIKIQNRLKKLGMLLFFSLLINSGCKFSYDDISLGQYTGSAEQISGFSRDNYGYVIYDIEAGKIVKGHNINKEFTPASVTKLFTSLFAVETLGYDYTFSTTLSYKGNISNTFPMYC